jgi:hypothetical protein
LGAHVVEIVRRRGWRVDVFSLAPLLHNRPALIPAAVEEQVLALRGSYKRIAVAYADCGTYGALDETCRRLGVRRLPGAHCYEVFGGRAGRAAWEDEPGTYVLTDFLVRSFRHTVVEQLGLDRYPELRDDYFRHYRRVVWLAQRPTPELRASAERAAETLGLPLTVVPVGDGGLERALARLRDA